MPNPEKTRIQCVSDLSQAEKDRVLELILDHIGIDLWLYKFDGESNRIIELDQRTNRNTESSTARTTR